MYGWSDAWLTTALESAIANESGLAGTHIEVETRQGVVRLRGVVQTITQREQAAAIARNFGGVLDLENELMVSP